MKTKAMEVALFRAIGQISDTILLFQILQSNKSQTMLNPEGPIAKTMDDMITWLAKEEWRPLTCADEKRLLIQFLEACAQELKEMPPPRHHPDRPR
jgi:hypothetical protein